MSMLLYKEIREFINKHSSGNQETVILTLQPNLVSV